MPDNASTQTDTNSTTMVMLNLTLEQRRLHTDAANAAMDDAVARGAEPNAWLREQFAGDLVLGLWPDPTEPGGVAVAVLKGHGRLLLVGQGKRPRRMNITAIRCKCAEEAEAMRRVFGDGRAKVQR